MLHGVNSEYALGEKVRIGTRQLARGLRQRIFSELRVLVKAGERVALLDFPNHSNVGDSIIWSGERQVLKELGARIIYTCDLETYSAADLARAIGKGTILLQGGGNFGDLWERHQRFREQVISDFPANKIILLPQSIHFKQRENLERARKVLNAHPDLALLLRDEESLLFARNEFKAESRLCPDMAFGLGPLKRIGQPVADILQLRRTDKESGTDTACEWNEGSGGLAMERVDWNGERQTWNRAIYDFLARPMAHRLRERLDLLPVLFFFRELLAKQRLMRGRRLLSRGRIVITNRLHGHILATLMNIPHVCLPDRTGKLIKFYRTWTHDCEIAKWADTPAEALEAAKDLLSPPAKEGNETCSRV